jgi:hypothetical protein
MAKAKSKSTPATQQQRNSMKFKPIGALFDWDNETWALTFLPRIRLASAFLNNDERSLEEIMADCVKGGLAPDQASDQASKMDGALTPYVGRPIADYVLDRGPPTNTIDMGANKRGFQWQLTRQTAGALVPISGLVVTVPPGQQQCTVSLIASTTKKSPALSDWIIESWRWNGEC